MLLEGTYRKEEQPAFTEQKEFSKIPQQDFEKYMPTERLTCGQSTYHTERYQTFSRQVAFILGFVGKSALLSKKHTI